MSERLRSWLTWPARLCKAVVIWLIALVLIFEEWGWEPLARILARIGQWPGFRWIENIIRGLPPYAALGLFLVPVLLLLPIKILALYWLAHGHQLLGLGVILGAKVGGTAITARLFMLTQTTLMQLPWFARWFTRWIDWKNAVMQKVRQSPAWQQAQAFGRHARHVVQSWLDQITRR